MANRSIVPAFMASIMADNIRNTYKELLYSKNTTNGRKKQIISKMRRQIQELKDYMPKLESEPDVLLKIYRVQ